MCRRSRGGRRCGGCRSRRRRRWSRERRRHQNHRSLRPHPGRRAGPGCRFRWLAGTRLRRAAVGGDHQARPGGGATRRGREVVVVDDVPAAEAVHGAVGAVTLGRREADLRGSSAVGAEAEQVVGAELAAEGTSARMPVSPRNWRPPVTCPVMRRLRAPKSTVAFRGLVPPEPTCRFASSAGAGVHAFLSEGRRSRRDEQTECERGGGETTHDGLLFGCRRVPGPLRA